MASRILVIIDPQFQTQPALQRALELARLTEISLHVVFFCDQENPSLIGLDTTEHLDNHLQRRLIWLNNMIQPYREEGLDITSEVRAFHRLYEEIVKTALSEDVVFVFKPMRHHNLAERTFFTSTDWNLIRTCPYPLLLINDDRPLKGRKIIAAVSVAKKDADHAELNRIILSQAKVISGIFGSAIKVVNALPIPAFPVGVMTNEPSGHLVMSGLADDHRKQTMALAAEFDIDEDQVQIIEGAAETVINRYAKETEAGVMILGTVARSGLSSLFVGNTAERVLEASSTDIIVVKQADFASPIA